VPKSAARYFELWKMVEGASSIRLGHGDSSMAQTHPNRPISARISRLSAVADLACQSYFCPSFASCSMFLRSGRSRVRITPGVLVNGCADAGALMPEARRDDALAACETALLPDALAAAPLEVHVSSCVRRAKHACTQR